MEPNQTTAVETRYPYMLSYWVGTKISVFGWNLFNKKQLKIIRKCWQDTCASILQWNNKVMFKIYRLIPFYLNFFKFSPATKTILEK